MLPCTAQPEKYAIELWDSDANEGESKYQYSHTNSHCMNIIPDLPQEGKWYYKCVIGPDRP